MIASGFKVDAQPQIIPQLSRRSPAHLSFAQERLWFLNQFNPDSSVHNNPTAIHLAGALSVVALEQSINEIIRRHEVLRTTFTEVDGQLAQVITSTMRVTLPVINLSGLPLAEREAEARHLSSREAQRAFDLGRGPLVRVVLLRLNKEEHVLLLNMHHIVSDERSVAIFTQELTVLYEAFSTGETSPLPELPIQYADYVVWQRRRMRGEVLEKHLSYWKRQLSGAPAVLKLPIDHPRPQVQSFRGARQSIVLSTDTTDALKSLSLREGATPFMTLLAAFQTLLWRYTGQEDVIVGTNVAGRTRAETEGLIGLFANHLVLRTNLSGDPSFRELLRRVKEVTLGAYEHQDMPFEKLIDELQPERSLSHTPLFQVLFTPQDAPARALEILDSGANDFAADGAVAHFDLTVKVIEEAEELSCVFEYNKDLFDAATIARMFRHFRVVVEAVTANPDQQLSTLPILTAAERHQLLVEWNDTKSDYPRERCIHELFEAQVERTPEAIAAIFGEEQLTYGELNRRANQLAHYLRKRGVGAEVPVGICVQRSTEMLIGLLGILKAGAAYVPLDPMYPKERLSFTLEDSQVPVLLTQERLVEILPGHGARVMCLDTDWEMIAQESAENLTGEAKAENLAYLIYTSGSTGRPKGVAIEHRSAVALLHWAREVFAPEQLAGVLAATSICFDLSVFELFVPLSWGGTIILAENALHLPALRAAEKVTLINTVPSAMAELLRIGGVPTSVRTVNLAGEPLPTPLVQQIYQLGTIERVFDLYGPSEDTTYSTFALRSGRGPATIGRPIANTQIYLLDRHLNPVPAGVPGELYIGGEGLARGYFNRPELTAEKFIPHPFDAQPGARLYKTGDRARYLPDGNLEFLGRMDHQVKVRGFRIELGEIEAVLGQHPTVRGTVVVAREDIPAEKRLVAYVVGDEEQPASVGELRSFLKEKLPDYMVPSAFVLLDELPMAPNGKVDRRALPAPEQTRTEQDGTFVAPRNKSELQLARVWEQVLGVQPVGATDDFFDLGGNSLLAVRLFAQIKKMSGKDLPLAVLFQAPTVEQLTPIVREQESTASWSSLVAVQPGGSRPPFFGVHGALANVLMYRDLARHLGPEQPVYGLQARGLDGKQEPHTRVEEMAAHYIAEIRTVQPEGPYYLGGASFGGLVAYEMAQQLHAAGQEVALLALFNTGFPGRPRYMPRPTPFHQKVDPYMEVIERHFNDFGRLKTKKYILTRVKGIRTRIRRRIWRAADKPHPDAGNFDNFPSPTIGKIWNACARAERDYVPQTYPGRITFFWAGDEWIKADHETRLGWSEVAAGGFEVHVVPGDHGSMRQEPHVKILGEKLAACLHRAQAASSCGQT